ncbi:MAG: TonB-dependent receptor plug domain-containing protein, partial [Rikenellaceae bacterium]
MPFAYNPVYADTHRGNIVDVAQQIKQTKITLNLKNKPIKYILSEIEKITGIGYVIKSDINTQALSSLSLEVKECSVEEALNKLFATTSCTYEIYNNIITVVNKSQKKESSTQPKQKQTLGGQVIDKDTKKPIAGATIIEVGTNNGAISDEKGQFIIPNISSGASVEVAFVGMKNQVVKLTGSNTIITMESDAMAVDDVVVTGIFTRKKESFTGSATTVTKRDLERTGSQNVFQSLKNLDPTLNIIDNMEFGSDPNKLPDMELRGTSSFPDVKNNYTTNPNLPLFILDGFETTVEKIYDLDMNRVESVTILKDAAAKAIYGSKAANGVIVIETTRIQSGEFRISYNGTLNLDLPDLSSYNLCNAREKLDLEEALGYYKSNTDKQDLFLKELYKKNRNNVENGVDTDWLSQPVRTGVGHKHAINMEIGNEQLRIGADLSYNNIAGAMKGSSR